MVHKLSSGTSKVVGVMDSGVGGLSVLKALIQELPEVQFVYIADNAYAPYGEKSHTYIQERLHYIAHYLQQNDDIDAFVIACNTASALAINELRSTYPQLPIIGIEPALKPAAAQSQTGAIGVLATRGTVYSDRFTKLVQHVKSQYLQSSNRFIHFYPIACDGLALAIEQGDKTQTLTLCEQFTNTLKQIAKNNNHVIDVWVLGCTHYPFALDQWQAVLGRSAYILEPSLSVAKQTRRVLGLENIATLTTPSRPETTQIQWLATGDLHSLKNSVEHWLHHQIKVQRLP